MRDSSSHQVVDPLEPPAGFSLVQGGPLFQLLRRTHLSGDALTLLRRRVLVIAAFTWLPLLALSAAGGQLLGGGAAVPFLMDVDVHIKFLVVVPLLIIAELVVHRRVSPLVNQFLEQGLIPAAARGRFDAAVASALRLRNSVLAEVVLLALVYGIGVPVLWRHYVVLDATTWYATPSAAGSVLSLVGVWYAFVSLPIMQFLLLRWAFRLFVWARFLSQVSRLDLDLVPTHPDGVGGLGFLSNVLSAYIPLSTAFGALLAGNVADHIFYAGGRLPDFKMQIAAGVVLLVSVFVAPLLVFVPRIAEAKRMGILEYGRLAQRYAGEFDAKWVHGNAPGVEPLLGSGDIQSLADMGNSFQVIRTMRMAPVAVQDVIGVALAALVPIAPLALTVMPLEELLKLAFGLLR